MTTRLTCSKCDGTGVDPDSCDHVLEWYEEGGREGYRCMYCHALQGRDPQQ